MDISEAYPVEGSNPFIPEAKCNIGKLSGSHQDNIVLNAHEVVTIPDDQESDHVDEAQSPELNETLLMLSSSENRRQLEQNYGPHPNSYFPGLLRHHSSECVTERVGYRETPYNSVNISSTLDVSHSPLISHPSSKDPLPTCAGCRQNITDQYLYRIQGLAWHESCAICSVCSVELVEVCFIVNKNELLCHRDYDRSLVTLTEKRNFIVASLK
ncbi:unnamed protein product [Schistosoma margrebowiei]|uniref:Uncharacterized protein n=1 Tax=Schistosoma margrebowiei TaxID=48269 RepID=A0A183LWE2_9TREM|nr:unnamed protein product [Schistosoma margrebowiei]